MHLRRIATVNRSTLGDPERSQSQVDVWPFLICLKAQRTADRDHRVLHVQVNTSLFDFDWFSADHADRVVDDVFNQVFVFIHLDQSPPFKGRCRFDGCLPHNSPVIGAD